MIIYEIYDEKAKNPAAVFLRSRDDDAIRSFEELIGDPNSTVFTISTADFKLYAIDPYADKLTDRVRLVRSGSDYSKLVVEQMRIERAKSDDRLFQAIGKAYMKLFKGKKNDDAK